MPRLQWKGRFGPCHMAQKWVIVCTALIACLMVALNADAEIPIPNASEPVIFHGEITKGLKIEMRLSRDGSNLRGTYLYEVFGRDIEVKGTVSEQGEIALQEFVKGKITGNFEGRFVGNNRIEGRWFKKAGDKGRSFYLVSAGTPVSGASLAAVPKAVKENREVSPPPKETSPVSKAEAPAKSAPMALETRPQTAPAPKVDQPPTTAAKKDVLPVQQPASTETKAQMTERAPALQVPPAKSDAVKTEPANIKPGQAPPSADQIALRQVLAEEPAKPAVKAEARPEEKSHAAGKSNGAAKKRSAPWTNTLLDMKVGGAVLGIILLGGGLAWLAVIAGGSAALRENSALFREVHAMGISFLPGIVLLALGVGAVLAVFVE